MRKDKPITTRIDSSDQVELGVLNELVGYHMRRASSVFANDFSRAVAGTGMRQVLFGILSIIQANPRINQGSVGRALNIQRANMVSLVNELVDRGLVLREIASEDRRAFSLTLTASGKTTIAQCLKRISEHETRLLSDLSDKERASLIDLLGRIEGKEA